LGINLNARWTLVTRNSSDVSVRPSKSSLMSGAQPARLPDTNGTRNKIKKRDGSKKSLNSLKKKKRR